MKKRLGVFATVLLAVCLVLSTGIIAFADDSSAGSGGEGKTVGISGITELAEGGSLSEYYSTEISFSRDVFKKKDMSIIGFNIHDNDGTYDYLATLADYFTVNGESVSAINEQTDDSSYEYTTFPNYARLDVPVMLISMATNKMTVAIHKQYVSDNGLLSSLAIGVTAGFNFTVKAPHDEYDEYIDVNYTVEKAYTLTLTSSGFFSCDSVYTAYQADREIIERKYSREDMDKLEYKKINLHSISTIVQVGDVREYNGETRQQVQYVVLYFDSDVCNQYIPYASCRKSTLTNLAANVYLTPKQIDAYYDYHMDEYLTKYIKIDGKTLADIRKDETDGTAVPEIAVRINYAGASSLPSSLTLNIEYNSVAWMSKNKPHTIEILKGFRTPLMGEIKADKKFEYNPDTEAWASTTSDPEFAAIPLVDESTQSGSGCGGALGGAADILVALGIISAAAGILILRRKVA